MPPSVFRSNAKKHRNSEALTETYEFRDRSHFTGVEPGWKQVADYALERVASHQDPSVPARYLHPDTRALFEAGSVFSTWWADSGPKNAGEDEAAAATETDMKSGA